MSASTCCSSPCPSGWRSGWSSWSTWSGFGISLVLLYYGSAVVSDAWRNNMVAYKTWYVPEWLLFLAIPVGAAMLAIEFALRFLRVQGVVRDTYDVTDRASL